MKIEVCDANNNQLNWLVAKSLGWITYPTDSIEMGMWYHTDPNLAPFGPKRRVSWFRPSTDWMDGGQIIEREGLNASVHVVHDGVITSWVVCEKDWPNTKSQSATGATLLVAAMRCFVISKLGDIVDISKFTSLNSPL